VSDEVNKKEAVHALQQVQSLFYRALAQELSPEEREAINQRAHDEVGFDNDLGEEITKAVLNYVCPETLALVSSVGFTAHGNLNPDTSETEVVLTVHCSSCNKEHPVAIVAFSEMLAMPCIKDPVS